MSDAFRKALRLVVLPLSVSAIVGVCFSFSPMAGIFLRAIGLAVCAVWAIAIFGMIMKAAWRARWHRCLGLIAIFAFVLPTSGMLAFWASDYIDLAITWSSYRSMIKTANQPTSFDWKPIPLMYGEIERTLMYDPSDALAHAKDIYGEYDGSFTHYRHLIGHFYVIENCENTSAKHAC